MLLESAVFGVAVGVGICVDMLVGVVNDDVV